MTRRDTNVTRLPPRSAERDASLRAADARIERMTWLLENLFRVGGRRFGLEPIIGLIPGAGDVVSGALGLAIIIEAMRFRIPRIVVVRMVLNTVLDVAIGVI